MLCVSLLLVAALGADIQQKVNPVEKVTTLLSKLQAEVEAEGKSEAEAYDKFACFCKEQADNKQYAIEKFTEQINVLTGHIEDKTAKKAQLDNEISQHNTDINTLEGEQSTAQGVRDTTNAAYAEREASLSTSIAQMKQSITALGASKDDMTGAKSLLSKYVTVIESGTAVAKSDAQVNKIMALVSFIKAPTDHAYSFKSNEVIATLENLLKEMKGTKVEADNTEREDRQEFEMTSGARRNQIKALQKSATEKSSASAGLEEEINADTTEKTETTNAKAADANFLADLTSKCETKATDFDSRSQTRTAELTAMSKALELLNGDVSKMYGSNKLGLISRQVRKASPQSEVPAPREATVNGVVGKWEFVPEVAVQTETVKTEESTEESTEDDAEDQEDEPVFFLQVPKVTPAALRKQLVGLLSSKAETLKSAAISTLLIKLKDAPSPFAKVKQMINDLVARLEAEAADEASQKGWCDTEMSETNAARNAAQVEVDSLNALHTEKKALSAQLTEQINDLSQEIADLSKALNEETELRNGEHDSNTQTLADANAGLLAIGSAIDFLNEFYDPSLIQQAPPTAGYERAVSANAGSDGQTVADMAPDTPQSASKNDASKSIIGMMEVIKSDFENTVSKTTDEENTADGDYQTFKGDTEQDISDKGELKDTKTTDRENADLDATQAEADLKTQKKLLQDALDELVKLKPVCVDTGMSTKERNARRDQEVEALKEALKLLQNTQFA